jgi:hypothetical protein
MRKPGAAMVVAITALLSSLTGGAVEATRCPLSGPRDGRSSRSTRRASTGRQRRTRSARHRRDPIRLQLRIRATAPGHATRIVLPTISLAASLGSRVSSATMRTARFERADGASCPGRRQRSTLLASSLLGASLLCPTSRGAEAGIRTPDPLLTRRAEGFAGSRRRSHFACNSPQSGAPRVSGFHHRSPPLISQRVSKPSDPNRGVMRRSRAVALESPAPSRRACPPPRPNERPDRP